MDKLFLYLLSSLRLYGKTTSALFDSATNHSSINLACDDGKYLISVYKMEEKENA